MRKAYEKLHYEIIRFRVEDIITTSGEDTLLKTSPDNTLGYFLTADGHYVVRYLDSGELYMGLDFGTTDPLFDFN